MTRPPSTPTPRRHTTSTRTQCANHPPGAAPASAMPIAAYVNGNANPSLSPASDVSANRASSSAASGCATGSLTCTSVASTGSVGASAAARRTALAAPRPSRPHPSSPTAIIDRGIVMPSRRHVVDQRRQPTGRLRARPAPMREMITQTSVRCSVTPSWTIGSGLGSCGMSAKPTMPAARNTIGIETGTRPSTLGSSAAASVASPTARKSSPAPSNSRLTVRSARETRPA